jgi:hypothetical protein
VLLTSGEFARPEREARLDCVRAASLLVRASARDCRAEADGIVKDAVKAVLRSWGHSRDALGPVLEFLWLQVELEPELLEVAVKVVEAEGRGRTL